MKKIIVILLMLSMCFGLCACSQEDRKFAECVAVADARVQEAQEKYFKDSPFTLKTKAESNGKTYTIELEVFQGDKLTNWIDKAIEEAARGSGLSDLQIEAAKKLTQGQYNSVSKGSGLLALVYLTLPLKDFEENGITLKLVHINNEGKETEVTEDMMIEAMEEL